MTKHLLGVAIFVSIATTAAFLYGFLNMPAIPVLPAVDGEMDNIAVSTWSRNNLAIRIITAEYDTRTGTMAADVELRWKRAEAPPPMLAYQIHLLDGSQNPRSLAIRSDSAVTHFEKGQSLIRRVIFTPSEMARFGDLNNVYMSIETSVEADSIAGRGGRLSNATFVPVLKIH